METWYKEDIEEGSKHFYEENEEMFVVHFAKVELDWMLELLNGTLDEDKKEILKWSIECERSHIENEKPSYSRRHLRKQK